MKELILFDMDGTLVDSSGGLAYSINRMLEKLSLDTFSDDKIKNWLGNGSSMLVKRALAGKKDVDYVDEELFNKAHKIFLEIYKDNLTTNSSLYEGVKDTLRDLKKKYKLAVVTNKPHQFVKTMLNNFEILEYFDYYLGASNLPKKPNPDMLEAIINYFNVSKDKAIMVGDTTNDMIASQRANIDFIAVSYGYNNEYLGEVVIDKFNKLLKLL